MLAHRLSPHKQAPLAARARARYASRVMKRLFDMDDRARLRERFFGATRSVLAQL
jgi:hypothetical protein